MTESKFKVGDWVFNHRWGWVKVCAIDFAPDREWPVEVIDREGLKNFIGIDGRNHSTDYAPSWFTVSEAAAFGHYPPKEKKKVKIDGFITFYPHSCGNEYIGYFETNKESAEILATNTAIAVAVPVSFEIEVEE